MFMNHLFKRGVLQPFNGNLEETFFFVFVKSGALIGAISGFGAGHEISKNNSYAVNLLTTTAFGVGGILIGGVVGFGVVMKPQVATPAIAISAVIMKCSDVKHTQKYDGALKEIIERNH